MRAMDNRDIPFLAIACTLAALLALLLMRSSGCGQAGVAHAQTIPSSVAARLAMGSAGRTSFTDQDMTPAVVLARVCVKEAGFASLPDCAPIAFVLLRVGNGDVVRGARRYSPRAFFPEHLRGRGYVAFLRGDGTKPRTWPTNMAWERYREDWLAVVAHCRYILDNQVPYPCTPDHWGAPHGTDHDRAVSRGWTRLDCGPTQNAFWSVR